MIKMKNIAIFFAVFLGLAVTCANDCPDCPDCPPPPVCDALECPDGWHLEKTIHQDEGFMYKHECVKDQVDPVDDPKDFYAIDMVPQLQDTMTHKLQALWWAAHVDPIHVVNYCAWSWNEMDWQMSRDEMSQFAMDYLPVHEEGHAIIKALPKVNRRCKTLGGIWCEKSNVKKTRKKKWDTQMDFFKSHSDQFRAIAQTRTIRQNCAYDSIKGWCNHENRWAECGICFNPDIPLVFNSL
jgi:hypothetical protein